MVAMAVLEVVTEEAAVLSSNMEDTVAVSEVAMVAVVTVAEVAMVAAEVAVLSLNMEDMAVVAAVVSEVVMVVVALEVATVVDTAEEAVEILS